MDGGGWGSNVSVHMTLSVKNIIMTRPILAIAFVRDLLSKKYLYQGSMHAVYTHSCPSKVNRTFGVFVSMSKRLLYYIEPPLCGSRGPMNSRPQVMQFFRNWFISFSDFPHKVKGP